MTKEIINREYLNKIKKYPHIKYDFTPYSIETSKVKSLEFYHFMNKRRSIRYFSSKKIPFEIIENIIRTAGTSPSGAHKQPWTFVVIKNQEIKHKIRLAAEEEERKSYGGRMSQEWLNDLAPIGTDWRKEFLDIAPYLIVVFRKRFEVDNEGKKHSNYYVTESVGISVGILISAIHNAGLVTLTHTPSPMNFLTEILQRPKNEVPFVLLPIGYPADNATVPDLKRKDLKEIMKVV